MKIAEQLRIAGELVRKHYRTAVRRAWDDPRAALGEAWQLFIAWFDRREFDESAILVTFAVAVGVAASLGVVLFYKLVDLSHFVFFRFPVRVIPGLDFPIYRPLLTAAGLALAAWVARRYAGGDDGPNVPFVQRAVARKGGVVPMRLGLGHAAASAVTLGSGGSAGSEGPLAVVGATTGSFLARAFRFSPERVKVLVAAGAAAGISASFNAPLAGAFFALEEILGSLTVNAFPAVVVSSVVAAVISRAFFGNHPAFPIPAQYGYSHPRELIFLFPLLGVLCGAVGAAFVRTQRWFGANVGRAPVRPALVPWIAGATVGLLVLASDGMIVGYGHLSFQLEVFGRMAFWLLGLLALGKILATSITLNAGGSGGVFTPSLFVGAATGGAFGAGMAALFQTLGIHAESYALVGMGAMIAAATHAPITAILIVFEMTNDYAIVLPLMLSVAVAYIVARMVEGDSLYTLWLRKRGEDLSHGADRSIMAGLRVADVFEPATTAIGEDATVMQMLAQIGRGDATEFPVITAEGRFAGIIRISDLGQIAIDREELAPLLVATDVMIPAECASPADSLLEAMRRMGVRGTSMLPVVDPATQQLLGVVTRAQVLACYEKLLATGEHRARRSRQSAPA